VNLFLAIVVVAITGFISLSYEILWFRALSFATGSSPAAFGLLLGAYLAGLAFGAFVSGIFCRDPAAVGKRRYLRHIALFVVLANLCGFLVLPLLAWVTSRSATHPAFAMIALSAAMLGAVLPLVSHFGVAPDAAAGRHVSYLYAGNILGSVLGSFLTGFVLLDNLSSSTIAGLLVGLGCATAAVLLMLSGVRGRPLAAYLAGLVSLIGCTAATTPRLFEQFYEKLLLAQQFTPDARFADLLENRSGVIAVTTDGTVYGGGVYDGRYSTDLRDDRNNIVRAYLVGALHPSPRHVLLVGLGTGSWAQVIAHNPSVESLTVVEVNPGYVQLLAKHPEVASLLSNPKVRIVTDDGRRWMSRHDARFDMIISNTPFHWRAQSTNLLSTEYCQLVRSHLAPGGIYYFNTTGSAAALKTAMVEFPYGLRYMTLSAVSLRPIAFDRVRLRGILTHYRIDGRPILDLELTSDRKRLEEVLGSLQVEGRASILARLASTPIVTDDNMYPEWHPSFAE
jgi:spermidine synthase